MMRITEAETKIIMNCLWNVLANRAIMRNESELELSDDKCVLKRAEELKTLGRRSTKLGTLATKENIEKIKKRKHRDFCMWERQAQSEHRKEKKSRERQKGATDKCLRKTEEIIDGETNDNEEENYRSDEEDKEMMLAVGIEMHRMFGEPESRGGGSMGFEEQFSGCMVFGMCFL